MDTSTTSPTPSSPERGSLGTGDLASKYTRLASEYSKVRAQLNVLKKAVVEEQNAKSRMAEALKEQETKGRKIEAEMDALTFRNAQLTRRVEILQQESENKAKVNNKKSKNEISGDDVNIVMSEELSLKIAENAKLHAALDEVDKKYESTISSLTSKIHDLESQLRKMSQKERAEDTKQKDLIQGLKVDNVDLVSRISLLNKELTDANDKITVLKVQLESQQGKIILKAAENDKIPLNKTEARIQTVEVLSTLGESVQNFVANMSDVHTYWEHRIKDQSGGKLTDASAQLSRLLLKNVKFLRPLEQSFQDILSNVLSNSEYFGGLQLLKKFQGFSQHFCHFVNYAVDEVEPLLVTCLQHESNASSCPTSQQSKNGHLCTAFKHYGRSLKALDEHIRKLAKAEDNNVALEEVENITVIVSQLSQQSAEISSVYHAKAKDESQLPTVTEALQNTNSCIVSALSSLAQGTSLLSHHLSDNLPKIGRILTTSDTFQEEDMISCSPEVMPCDPLEQKLDDMDVKEDENLPLLSGEDAVANLKVILDGVNDKLKKAEQSKEHWKLECQLVQMKLDKLNKDVNKDDDNANVSPNQDLVKARIDELVAEKLLADSKAAQFYLECLSLQKRVQFWEKTKKKAINDLKEAHNNIEEMREEAKLTSVNYEDQLSMMSEHLANMNDKLTSQTDEIQRLKYEISKRK